MPASVITTRRKKNRRSNRGMDSSKIENPKNKDEEAEEIRKRGNEAFAKGLFRDAISVYLTASSMDKSNPSIHGNLSASYFKLNNGAYSVKHARKAIRIDPTWAKGYYHLGRALRLSERYRESLVAFRQSIDVEDRNKSQTLSFATVNSLISEVSRSFCSQYFVPIITDAGWNDRIEVRYVNVKLRFGVFALQEFAPGEIVFGPEEPLVSTVMDRFDPAEFKKWCSFCLKPSITDFDKVSPKYHPWIEELGGKEKLSSFVQCSSCDFEFYCSEECKNRAWEWYHQLVCCKNNNEKDVDDNSRGTLWTNYIELCDLSKRNNPLAVAKMMSIVLTRCFKMELETRSESCKDEDEDEDEDEVERLEKIYQSCMEPFAAFVSVSEPSKIDSVFVDILKNMLKNDNAKSTPFVQRLVTVRNFALFDGVIRANVQSCLPFTPLVKPLQKILEGNGEQGEGEGEKTAECLEMLNELQNPETPHCLQVRGCSLLAIGNMCNHSCKPNIVSSSITDTHAIGFIAARRIQPGDELRISYIDETQPESERNWNLRGYHFECDCSKCIYERKRNNRLRAK